MLNLYEVNKQILKVEDGSITAIIGSSGSGKSFFAKTISENYNIPLIKNIFLVEKKQEYPEDILVLLKSFFKKSLLKKDNLSLEDKTILAIINSYFSDTIIIDDVLSYINESDKLKIINFLRKKRKTLIYTTSNVSELIYADRIIIIENGEIVTEDKAENVLKDERLLKKAGLGLSFIFDLSNKLICYDLINEVYISEKDLVRALWKK